MVDGSSYTIGLLMGVMISGVVRICFGRFIVYEASRGWVWEWSRFDRYQLDVEDRVNRALETGAAAERSRQAVRDAERARMPLPTPPET